MRLRTNSGLRAVCWFPMSLCMLMAFRTPRGSRTSAQIPTRARPNAVVFWPLRQECRFDHRLRRRQFARLRESDQLPATPTAARCATTAGYAKARKPMLPMIGIPTTAGTGSEAQSYAVISDAETKTKMACGDPKAAFAITVLDPELTRTVPDNVRAASGFDAISHAVETLVTKRRNALSLDLHARGMEAASLRIHEDGRPIAGRHAGRGVSGGVGDRELDARRCSRLCESADEELRDYPRYRARRAASACCALERLSGLRRVPPGSFAVPAGDCLRCGSALFARPNSVYRKPICRVFQKRRRSSGPAASTLDRSTRWRFTSAPGSHSRSERWQSPVTPTGRSSAAIRN